jgi:alkylation response protein AidB-like acyl-CoA dehydrogenase
MLGLPQEQSKFREFVRDFVARNVTPYVREWEGAGRPPGDLFRRMGACGLLGVRISEESGGMGRDIWFLSILIEELMRSGSAGVVMSVLAHTEFAVGVIDREGTSDLRERFVKPAVRGEVIGALGITEPTGGSDVGAICTRAERAGDDYVIDGAKKFIGNGSIADFVVTAVRTGGRGPGGISLIVVPADARGFRRGPPLRKVCGSSLDSGQLFFEGCRVPAHNLLGPLNGGFRQLVRGFESERLMLTVMAYSHMQLLYEEARRYGREREVFGSKLLGFQTWRHRLADVRTTIEASVAITHRAMARHVSGEPANDQISMAKLFVTEHVASVAKECAQMFGGNAVLEDSLMGRLHRDAFGYTIGAGTSEMMREMIASAEGLRG